MPVQTLEHPLAHHLLAKLRDAATPPAEFRTYCSTLAYLLALKATENLPVRAIRVKTPLVETEAFALNQGIVAVPILRAGLGMLDPIVSLFPDVSVGYIGLERHEATAIAESYYCKLPNLEKRYVMVLDPMLATGGSACQAVTALEANGDHQIAMVSIVAAPEGIEKLQNEHPNVTIYTASIDDGLDDKKYIVPGLGDFGDRLYGTFNE